MKLRRSSRTGVTDVGEAIETSDATWEVLKAPLGRRYQKHKWRNTSQGKEKAIRMAESAVVAVKRVTIAEQRAGGD